MKRYFPTIIAIKGAVLRWAAQDSSTLFIGIMQSGHNSPIIVIIHSYYTLLRKLCQYNEMHVSAENNLIFFSKGVDIKAKK